MAMNRFNLRMLSVHEHIRSAQKRLFSKVIKLIGSKRCYKNLRLREPFQMHSLNL